MPYLFTVDWQHFFVPSVALAEITLRGSLIHLGIFALPLCFGTICWTGSASASPVLRVCCTRRPDP
jgi:hypothetical protein